MEKKYIEDYERNREKYITKGKGADFREAIRRIDEYLSDPEVSYIKAKTIQNSHIFLLEHH